MKKALLSDLSPVSKIVFTVILVLVSFIIFAFAGALVAIPLFDVNIFTNPDVLNDYSSIENINTIKFFQIIQSIGLFIVPAIIAGYFFHGNLKYLGVLMRPGLFSVIMACVIIITAQPFINWMLQINEMLKLPEFLSGLENWMLESEKSRIEITEIFLDVSTVSGFVVNIIMFGVIAAVGEELIFRGLLLKLFNEWVKNIHVAVIITSILFSALHVQFYGFLPRLMLGIFLGYTFVWSRSLWVPIVAHFINNASAVTIYYLVNNNFIKGDAETAGSIDNNFLLITSIIVLSVFIYSVYYFEKKRGEKFKTY